jgi:valyl-tRNA synthetase
MICLHPEQEKYDRELISRFETVKEIISSVRTARKEREISNSEPLELFVRSGPEDFDQKFAPVIRKMCNLSDIKFTERKHNDSASFMVGTTEYFIPVGTMIDIESERMKLTTELDYYRGFLDSVMKKLDNVRFVANAPAGVLEHERKKKRDTEVKIRNLQEAIEALSRKG